MHAHKSVVRQDKKIRTRETRLRNEAGIIDNTFIDPFTGPDALLVVVARKG